MAQGLRSTCMEQATPAQAERTLRPSLKSHASQSYGASVPVIRGPDTSPTPRICRHIATATPAGHEPGCRSYEGRQGENRVGDEAERGGSVEAGSVTRTLQAYTSTARQLSPITATGNWLGC